MMPCAKYSVPQNSFPLPTGSVFSFATLGNASGKDYAAKVPLSRIRRGNRHFILRNARDEKSPERLVVAVRAGVEKGR